jgi:hypothetical protein
MKRPPGSSGFNRSKIICAMKDVLTSFALRVALLFVAFAIVSAATSSAQTPDPDVAPPRKRPCIDS